jgi:hypothetical protein
MATTYYDADDFYMLNSEVNELKLSVQLGEGMSGGYLIFHGDELMGANTEARISKREFVGTWITITIIIKDKPGNLSWASVMATLQEDSQIPKSFGPYRRKMEKHLDTVCYTIKIKIRK